MYYCEKPLIVPISLRVAPDLRDDLDPGGLVAPVGHVAGQLLVGEGVGGVRPEGELRPEHGLALQARALPDEQVVEVALRRPILRSDYDHNNNK